MGPTLALIGKVLGFIGLALAASRWLPRLIDRVLERLPREFFPCGVRVPRRHGGGREALGLSEAIGALLAGIVLAGTEAREEIEERFFSFRDLFGGSSSSSSGSRSTLGSSAASAGCCSSRFP